MQWWKKWWSKQGTQSSDARSAGAQPSSVRGLLPMLNNGLEIGMCDNAILTKVFSELSSTPETLLPDALGPLCHTSFLLWKCGRSEDSKRLLLTCLAWYLKDAKDQEAISTLTENIEYVFNKEGRELSVEDIHRLAKGDNDAAARRTDISGQPKTVVELAEGKVISQRERYAEGFTPPIPSDLPLTTFRGWLKRLDPAVLNPTGKLVMEHVFPMFGEPTPEHYVARTERLIALNVALSPEDLAELSMTRTLLSEGVQARTRRHRRFSGGDGLLPRNCYASLCKDAAGNDNGSLSREVLAYSDPRIPGAVFVGDSTSARLNAVLGNAIGVRPGFCAMYVFLFAPADSRERAVFDAMYGPLLEHTGGRGNPVNAIAFETRVDECTIENVIDLRLPHTQRWFFEHFKNGDGHVLIKDGGSVRDFCDLIPTLMHPRLGGSDVTHAIGSWMRSSGVNGLIFPSARSDASTTIKDGELADWHGWNFVDYRTSRNLPATEVTTSPGGWPDFLQPGVKLVIASGGALAGSWHVTNLQSRYDQFREEIESSRSAAGSPADIGPSS